MKPVKVCCFCESWESGGIESFLSNVFCRMNPEKVQIDLVCAEIRSSIFTQTMEEHGIRFCELSGNQRNLPKNYKCFRKLLKEQQYDVFHLNAFQGLSLYYLRLAKEVGIPVRIAHSHNTALRSSRTRALKQLIHELAKEHFTKDATDLWACSSIAAEFLFSAPEIYKFQWIPNGIETERFRFNKVEREIVRQQLGLTNAFVIGNIGRLCEQKNQTFLLDVFNEAVKQNPQARLLLIGEGEQEAALKKKAKRLGIADKTIFYGVSKQPEKLLWAMDIFVFPSLFEGLGIAVIEAQVAGLSTICSNFVPAEAIATPLAWRVDLAEGADAWAEKILAFRCTEACEYQMELLRQGYEIRDVVQKIEKVYCGEEQSSVLFKPVKGK